MAGAGKSTLLADLGWWWQRTSLIGKVFSFSYEDRAWTAAQIIREVRAQLLSPVEQARADTMPAAAQVEQVAQLMRAHRHLLILDNAESIMATPAAIPHALEPAEQAQIRGLLARLRGGRTLVLIGSPKPRSGWPRAASGRMSTHCPAWIPRPHPPWLTASCAVTTETGWLDDAPIGKRWVELMERSAATRCR